MQVHLPLSCGEAAGLDRAGQGIGGIGKTTFATMLAKQVRHAFAAVFWRTLRNAPSVENILKSYFASDERQTDWPKDLDEQITSFITSLRQQRHLLVLDNVESVLQSGQRPGQHLVGYEGYGQLFQRIGETEHHSCLLLTSREKPKEVARLEGTTAPVRSFSLSGVTQADGQKGYPQDVGSL